MEKADIREFIWGIGNSTTENELCASMKSFFHLLCMGTTSYDEEVCNDFRLAYTTRCGTTKRHLDGEGSFLYVAIVLIFCLTVIAIIQTKELLFIPESAVTIITGLFTGLILVSLDISSSQVKFNADAFFEILLPFIIFETGYNMEKALFERNFFEILLLAVVGTLMSFFLIFGILYGLTEAFHMSFSMLDCAMFASLISSTDPIAIVSVFSSLGVDPNLYALVFGESILNDGVSVALYASMKFFYHNPGKTMDTDGPDVVVRFFKVFIGSLLLGFFFALFVAWIWKVGAKQVFTNPVLETLVYMMFAILPYYVADSLGWSGVISIVSNSMALSVYAHGNLSKTSKFHVIFLVECFARLFEAIMFGYLGMEIVMNNERMVWNEYLAVGVFAVLFSRAVTIFSLLFFRNLCQRRCTPGFPDQIPLRHQLVIWFSGFRGALAFALAVTVPQYDSVTKQGSQHVGEMLAMTVFVIMLNVLVMGSMSPCFLKKMDVVVKPVGVGGEELDPPRAARPRRKYMMLFHKLHHHVLLPIFTNQLAPTFEEEEEGEMELTETHHRQIVPVADAPPAQPPSDVVTPGEDLRNDLLNMKSRYSFLQKDETLSTIDEPMHLQRYSSHHVSSESEVRKNNGAGAIGVASPNVSGRKSPREESRQHGQYSKMQEDKDLSNV